MDPESQNELFATRRAKLDAIRALGVDPFGGRFDTSGSITEIRARFAEMPKLNLPGALSVKTGGREIEILANGNSEQLLAELKTHSPEELRCEALSLEEIFVASDILKKAKA